MLRERASGILLAISALDTEYGIGDLGPKAYAFIDHLAASDQKYWQLLPLGIPDFRGCPYASYSSFGGNPQLISPALLKKWGLIDNQELEQARLSSSVVNYPLVNETKNKVLRKAYERFKENNYFQDEYQIFVQKNNDWCFSLGLFLSLTQEFGIGWHQWPQEYHYPVSQHIVEGFQESINFHVFTQFLFFKQWDILKEYANEKGIKLIGDIPIFVAHHSMDTWQSTKQFKLESNGHMLIETGAPPDDFNQLGQKWNTPNFNWDEMCKDNFSWWLKRVDHQSQLFDVIRIDHFIGLYNVWEVPVHTDARSGHWVLSRGEELLNILLHKNKDLSLVAEDLGEITGGAIKLRNKYQIPGMCVLQFAFDSNPKNLHLPEQVASNSVYYTGTHDNDTLMGWYKSISQTPAAHLLKQEIQKSQETESHWSLIDRIMHSQSALTIIPLQDLLGLDSSGRFNTPGTIKNNWIWRANHHLMEQINWKKLKYLTKINDRVCK